MVRAARYHQRKYYLFESALFESNAKDVCASVRCSRVCMRCVHATVLMLVMKSLKLMQGCADHILQNRALSE